MDWGEVCDAVVVEEYFLIPRTLEPDPVLLDPILAQVQDGIINLVAAELGDDHDP